MRQNRKSTNKQTSQQNQILKPVDKGFIKKTHVCLNYLPSPGLSNKWDLWLFQIPNIFFLIKMSFKIEIYDNDDSVKSQNPF